MGREAEGRAWVSACVSPLSVRRDRSEIALASGLCDGVREGSGGNCGDENPESARSHRGPEYWSCSLCMSNLCSCGQAG